METKTNEISPTDLLRGLGIRGHLPFYYKQLANSDATLDFNSFYQKLSMAMSYNYFKIPLQCKDDWQILILSGIEFDSKSLQDWIDISNRQWMDVKGNGNKRLFNIKDNWGATPLHYLFWAGNTNNVKWLLNNCSDLPNKKDRYGRTPIHFLGLSGNLGSLDLSKTKFPKELYKKDASNTTPIHYCGWSPNPKSLEWIKNNNPKDLTKLKDGCKRTPVHYYVWSDKPNALEEIKSISPESIKMKDDSGKTIIHFALKTGDCDRLNYIHANHFKALYKTDKYGTTPIQLAVKSGNPEILNVINALCPGDFITKNKNGVMLSHYAALSGNHRSLNLALSLNKDPKKWELCNAFNADERTKIINTLLKAFQKNYTLTDIEFNDFKISDDTKKLITERLERNLLHKQSVESYSDNKSSFFKSESKSTQTDLNSSQIITYNSI